MARAPQTVNTHRNMYAYLALLVALSAQSIATPAPPRDRLGYEREIDSSSYKQTAKLRDYILNEDYINNHKSKSKLITKYRPDEAVAADNVILESNVVKIVRPRKLEAGELVRQRRGYNLENVNVPARYPYLPVPRYNRFRRWG
ncbi:uncharacterized protein LOC110999790 [Pieris rapae]|uniref:uncharacterized protein LOC110999790 n=1 Tax=Pieris rapae TaxID=64459 RepID=UPI001E2813E0|nr:uncharacterized protein LOC110999790 [Pieris rapae]